MITCYTKDELRTLTDEEFNELKSTVSQYLQNINVVESYRRISDIVEAQQSK